MYCTHCAYEINEKKLEKKKISQLVAEGEVDENSSVEYICPRCGHLIHKHVSEQEIKTLSAASHAQIQVGRNHFASGMSCNCIGAILLILAVIFFILAKKPANNFKLVTNYPEFYVSMIGFAVGAALVGVGLVLTILGLINKHKHEKLLEDIQDDVFHQ